MEGFRLQQRVFLQGTQIEGTACLCAQGEGAACLFAFFAVCTACAVFAVCMLRMCACIVGGGLVELVGGMVVRMYPLLLCQHAANCLVRCCRRGHTQCTVGSSVVRCMVLVCDLVSSLAWAREGVCTCMYGHACVCIRFSPLARVALPLRVCDSGVHQLMATGAVRCRRRNTPRQPAQVCGFSVCVCVCARACTVFVCVHFAFAVRT